MMTTTLRGTVLVLLLALCGCSAETPPAAPAPAAEPTIDQARILLPPPGAPMAAGYFVVRNPSPTPLELRVLGSSQFDSVEMHETVEENGVSRMLARESFTVPAQGELEFVPGGAHLMISGARHAPEAGQKANIAFELRAPDGQTRTLEAPFSLEAAGGEGHEHHH